MISSLLFPLGLEAHFHGCKVCRSSGWQIVSQEHSADCHPIFQYTEDFPRYYPSLSSINYLTKQKGTDRSIILPRGQNYMKGRDFTVMSSIFNPHYCGSDVSIGVPTFSTGKVAIQLLGANLLKNQRLQ